MLIPAFLPRQRWFGEQGPTDQGGVECWRVARSSGQPRTGRPQEIFLANVVEAHLAGGEPQRYFLPLAAIWSPAETELRQGLIPVTLAELRQFRREGRCRRRPVAGRFCAGADGGDPPRSDDAARRWRDPLSQDADFRAASRCRNALSVRRSGSGTVEQLGVLRRLRDAEDLPAASTRSASRDRNVAFSGRARRVCQHAAAAGDDRTRSRRRKRRRRRTLSVCCSASCAIKEMAGRRR